jgi:hypothetical protein
MRLPKWVRRFSVSGRPVKVRQNVCELIINKLTLFNKGTAFC